jgi:hypothetical protein
MGLVVTFEGVTPAKANITINSFNDSTVHKTVSARTSEGMYILWTDAVYDAIGDWTSAQAIERIKELAIAGVKK